MNAADLAWPAMTDDERRRIENQLIRVGIDHAFQYTHGIHNIQCWSNACTACGGYFLNDPDIIRRSNEGKLGFKAQVEQGILEDGLWFERSLGYHSYALSALIYHCKAAMRAGDDLYKLGRLPMMFTAPLQLTQPDLTPPSLNDMKYSKSRVGPTPLEYAVAWYGDRHAASALRMLYDLGAQRSSLDAFHVGEALPEVGKYAPPPSANLPGAGLAILRRGAGDDALCAMVEYGEHGGGHGHPDKLQLIFYGLGRALCPDIGTTGYGVDLHKKYYKTTPGHNTVTIGGRSQDSTTGKLLAFEVKDGYAAASAESSGAYDGWRLVRQLLLTDAFLLDAFTVEGKAPETIDWFLRAPGKMTLSVDAQPISEKPLSDPYGYFKDLRGATTDGDWTATWDLGGEGKEKDKDKGGRLVVTMKAERGTQVARSVAPGPIGTKWDTLRARRHAGQTRFIAVYQTVPPGRAPAPVVFDAATVAIGGARVPLRGAVETVLTPEN